MNRQKAEDLYNLRENGNITEFNKAVKRLSKSELLDFVYYTTKEINNNEYFYYIRKALE